MNKEDFGFFDEMPQITPRISYENKWYWRKIISTPVEKKESSKEKFSCKKTKKCPSNNENNDDASKNRFQITIIVLE